MDDSHVRRGRLRPKQGKVGTGSCSCGAGGGSDGKGQQAGKARASGQGRKHCPGNRKTKTQPGLQENKRGAPPPHSRGRSRDSWDASQPHSPTRCSGGAASTHLIRLSSADPSFV